MAYQHFGRYRRIPYPDWPEKTRIKKILRPCYTRSFLLIKLFTYRNVCNILTQNLENYSNFLKQSNLAIQAVKTIESIVNLQKKSNP